MHLLSHKIKFPHPSESDENGLLAIGGDGSSKKDKGAKANRFKPVVKFIGPFELEANSSETHTIQMPNYVGSVRTMVIAGNNETCSYGSAEETTPVKKPLMVLATLPRIAGPSEKIELPITIFAMDKKIKDVNIKIETNKLLEIEGSSSTKIHFSREGDKVINFKLNVADKLGIAKVKVIAKSGKETATYEIELDVRASNPMITDVIDAMIESGETWESDYSAIGMTGTNSGLVEISSIPPMKLEERLQYLIRYPHGCIEQTTSSAFPQLFLSNLLELDEKEKEDIDVNIKACISRLKTFQISTGGMSYWPGESYTASDWGTNYAGHFMLEAKAKGYNLPHNFLSSWIKFQKQRANSWTSDRESNYYRSSSQLTQAYRLYTLALAKKPALGAMNRLRTLKNLSVSAKWRLAAAYQLIGKTKVANSIILSLTTNVKAYKELSYSYGSAERDKAMILETLTMLGRKNDAKYLLDELSKAMSSNRWYSTQTTAYTLLAVSKFVGQTDSNKDKKAYSYSINNGASKDKNMNSPISQFDLNFKNSKTGKLKITNTGDKVLFIKLQLSGIPLIGDKTNSANNLKLDVKYLDLKGTQIDPSRLTQGTDFMAEVTITHPGVRRSYQEMALTQIFPSGWEIRNLRLDNIQSSKTKDKPRYQDIRDDRVLSYFDVRSGHSKTFRVLLNASYLGTYYLPTVSCEAMYDNEISARQAGRWVEVVEAGK